MTHITFGHCIVGVAVAAVLLTAFGVSGATFAVLAVSLACPLMTFVMMRAMMRERSSGCGRGDEPADRH